MNIKKQKQKTEKWRNFKKNANIEEKRHFFKENLAQSEIVSLFCIRKVGESGGIIALHSHGGRKWGQKTKLPQSRKERLLPKTKRAEQKSVMGFFKGQETFSVDNKGRVNIPAKMRRTLSPDANDTFIVTRGVDKCIAAYPLDEWKKYEERFTGLNQYSERERFFLRSVLQWSEDVEIDGQQRVSLPKKLMEFAGITGKATIVGMVDHIEFWDPDTFEAYMNGFETSYEEAASQVMAPRS